MSLQQRIPSHQCLRDFNYQMSSASDESNLAAENSTQDDDFQNLRVDITQTLFVDEGDEVR